MLRRQEEEPDAALMRQDADTEDDLSALWRTSLCRQNFGFLKVHLPKLLHPLWNIGLFFRLRFGFLVIHK